MSLDNPNDPLLWQLRPFVRVLPVTQLNAVYFFIEGRVMGHRVFSASSSRASVDRMGASTSYNC